MHAEVQKQAAKALQEGKDVLIQSQTGSGKTLAFLLPLLSALQYPPDVYPDDLKVLTLPDLLVRFFPILAGAIFNELMTMHAWCMLLAHCAEQHPVPT